MEVWAVPGIPEVVAGDDIGELIAERAELQTGDIVVVTSKIVSKAEGRAVQAQDREQAITDQTVRVVATKGATRIVENPLGLVMAAAGVDSSNAPEGIVLLLPEDPDKSAEKIKATLDKTFGIETGVIISDTLGRAWRQGQTDAAIGAAGVKVLDDLRGTTDTNGKELEATIAAVGDELASAAELVKGKASNLPVAIIRGLGHLVGESQSANELIRPPHEDLFRLGTAEAWDEGYRAGLSAGDHAQ